MTNPSERSDWILRALAMWSRVLTAQQIARWFGVEVATAKALLGRLVESRLVVCQQAQAQLLGPVASPLYRHRCGDPLPAPGPLSWKARKRFEEVPAQNVTIYSAAPRIVTMYGLPNRDVPKPEHATHDIICGEMWMYALRRWPLLTVASYQMEDVYADERVKFEKVEDARFYRNGNTLCVFESVGRYSKARTQDFLCEMAKHNFCFYLW